MYLRLVWSTNTTTLTGLSQTQIIYYQFTPITPQPDIIVTITTSTSTSINTILFQHYNLHQHQHHPLSTLQPPDPDQHDLNNQHYHQPPP